ncbi:MAG TPA: AI-2E family transporter, partial [Microvirga sp.]|nr:AI-2E family transporter [Microvirga sp.]
MSVERQIGFWVAALVVTGLFLFILRDILLPFVAGFALAYLLDPLADRLQRIGLSRLAATLVILVLFVLVFIVALVLLLPFVAHELASFIERLPGIAARLQQLLVEQGGPLIERLGGAEAMADMQRSIGELVGQGVRWFGTFLT